VTKPVIAVLLALCTAALASYTEMWESDEVGLGQYVSVVGVQNTDADPAPELVYFSSEMDQEVYIYALDCLSGEVEPVVEGDLAYVYTDSDKKPRLIDVNNDGVYELLLLGQQEVSDPAQWFLYGFEATAATGGPGYTRLREPKLGQNKPNPLNKTTEIGYEVPVPTKAAISIYDASGRIVRRIDAGAVEAGKHTVTWNRDDAQGKPVAPGAYYYVLEADGRKSGRKALVAE
jgi:hypothetical protein